MRKAGVLAPFAISSPCIRGIIRSFFYWYVDSERGPRGRYVYRYAHNDIVQFVAEYGLIGAGLIFGPILSLLVQLVHNRGIHLFAVCMILLGILQAFIDFIFNSPAYWMAFVAILATSTKLLQLDAKRHEHLL